MTKHERILIVDDEEQMRELLAKVLEKNGYQVSTAGDGAQALVALEKDPVDLVVSDVRMPGLDGMEALGAVNLWPDLARGLLAKNAQLPLVDDTDIDVHAETLARSGIRR